MQLKKIVDREFIQAVSSVCSKDVNMMLAYKLSNLLDKIKEEQAKYEELRKKLIDRHGEKNEDGSLKTNEDATEYVMTDRPAFDKDFEELQNIEVEMPTFKIAEFLGVNLSGRTVSSLKDILTP